MASATILDPEATAAVSAPAGTRAAVRSLGYTIVEATDLGAWEEFGAGLLGLQVAVKTADRLEFRLDEKEYRVVVNKADRDGLAVIGWEVGGAAELAELSARVEAAGYPVRQLDRDEVAERRITAGAVFRDPDGLLDVELHYGLRETIDRFVSPTGARFVTGTGGLGHVFQSVVDWEAYNHLYFEVLGFKLSDHIEVGPRHHLDLTFLYCNERHHSYAFAQLPNVGSAIGHLMFEVDELDIVGRAWDKVLEEDAAPVLSTLGKHTNDKMVSFYVRTPSNFGLEFGTGGIKIDDATWTPTRYNAAHYWGHNKNRPVDPTDAADNS